MASQDASSESALMLAQMVTERLDALERALVSSVLRMARPGGAPVPAPGLADFKHPPPTPPPEPSFPDLVIEFAACIEKLKGQISLDRTTLTSQIESALRSVQQDLNQFGVGLFENPKAVSKCLKSGLDNTAVWGNDNPDWDAAQVDEIVDSIHFIDELRALLGVAVTGDFIREAFQQASVLINERTPIGEFVFGALVFEHFDRDHNQIVATFLGSVLGDIPLIGGTSFRVPITIGLSLDNGSLHVNFEADLGNIDFDGGPFMDFFLSLLTDLFDLGKLNVGRLLIALLGPQSAVTISSTGDIVISPIEILIPRKRKKPGRPCRDQPIEVCNKTSFAFSNLRVGMSNVDAIGIGLIPREIQQRRPSVKISGSPAPIRMPISKLHSRVPFVAAGYQLSDFHDLRGSATKGMWEIEWSSPQPGVNFLETSLTSVTAFFGILSAEKANLQIGDRIKRTVEATVRDVDCCEAKASFDTWIVIVPDPQPSFPPMPNKPSLFR